MSIASCSTSPLAGVVAALDQAVAWIRDGGLAGLRSEELARVVGDARAVQARAEFALLEATREVDVSGAYRAEGALSAAGWLRQNSRMAPAETSRVARTARALSDPLLAPVRAALAAGEIDPDAAAEIAKVIAPGVPAEAVQRILPHLMDAARHNTVREVAAIARRFREALDDDADAEAMRRHERRGVHAATTLDGSLAGRFTLDPVTGSLLLTALDAAEPLTPGDRRTAAQRRADGLGAICRHFLDTADVARTGGARPHLIVTQTRSGVGDSAAGDETAGGTSGVPVAGLSPEVAGRLNAALADALADEGPRLSWIGPVPAATAARVACDAMTTVVDVDADGSVTGMTRKRRFFTWAQRRAIIARDGDRCPWPYCDRPIAWADGHHVHSHSEGGPSTVANGALPCEGHHVLLHEGGWALVRLTDGRYLAHQPATGRTLGPEPSRRPRGVTVPPHRRE